MPNVVGIRFGPFNLGPEITNLRLRACELARERIDATAIVMLLEFFEACL